MQQQPHSPWHSPILYLFGGLAAIYVGSHNEERDLEKAQDSIKACPVFEEKIVVIMAGDDNPTYLATPVFTNNVSSFHQDNETISNEKEAVVSEKNEDEKEPKQNTDEQHQDLKSGVPVCLFPTSNSSQSSWTRRWSKKSDKASCGLYGARLAKGGC
ncbi:hypothetical protein IFM89_014549 [Coptis chinensis]|uniref:Uncharacterized protein n=1 Tax=Coptis chinensis TaxID=261450 RepID=A0A835H3Q1_9MAGN|nr:hypothetical protein IFM89_014549 [Coptis chinensis]